MKTAAAQPRRSPGTSARAGPRQHRQADRARPRGCPGVPRRSRGLQHAARRRPGRSHRTVRVQTRASPARGAKRTSICRPGTRATAGTVELQSIIDYSLSTFAPTFQDTSISVPLCATSSRLSRLRRASPGSRSAWRSLVRSVVDGLRQRPRQLALLRVAPDRQVERQPAPGGVDLSVRRYRQQPDRRPRRGLRPRPQRIARRRRREDRQGAVGPRKHERHDQPRHQLLGERRTAATSG